MIEKKWKTLAGQEIDLKGTIESELVLAAQSNSRTEIHIGSDSQQFGTETEYVTVVVMHRTDASGAGKGGRVFFSRERVERIRELRLRLWKEVWRSTELAMELTAPPEVGTHLHPINITAVHIDANVDPRHKSSKHVEELVGLVMGQGFNAIAKPEAWAASHAADHAVKHKDQRTKPHADGKAKRKRRAA